MIEALRKTPKVEVPYKDRWEVAAAALATAQRPEMNLPDEPPRRGSLLAAAGTPGIDKPERYDPYRLPGHVDFLYDGKAVPPRRPCGGSSTKRRAGLGPRPAAGTRAGRLTGRAGLQPMEGWQAHKYNIWIPSQKLPEAAESLVAEGWIVEAQGYYVRRAGTWRMNVTSGVDWFDLDGTLDFDGMEVQLPESSKPCVKARTTCG